MQKTTHRLTPFITLLLAASIFLSIPINASAIIEDNFEENDTFTSSWMLGPGEYSYLCQADDDYYRIEVPENASLKVEITFSGTLNDMELEFYDDTYVLIDGSYFSSNNETLEYAATYTEYITIKVFGWNNSEAYNMSVQLFGPAPPIADVEPNNFLSQASVIWPKFNAGNNQSDVDWYHILVNTDDELEIFLYYNNGPGFLAMELFYFNGTSILNATGDYLDWTNTNEGQNFFIKISGPNLGQLYTLNIFIYHNPNDDGYEDNDGFSTAWFLNPGFYGGMALYDADWFMFELYGHETLSVDLYPADWETSGFYMYLYDSAYNHVASAWSIDGYYQIEWANPNDYSVYVYMEVVGHYDGDMYDLWANIGPSDDWMEPNDELGQAWDLPLGWTYGLVQFDEDWFRIWMEPNDALHIDHYYDWGSTTLNLTLFDEYSTELAWNGWENSLDWTNNADYGQYVYLRVIGESVGYWYDLNILINGQGAGDDWAEENDDYQNYFYLGLDYYDSLLNYDDDYFAIDLKTNDTLKVWVHSSAAYWLRLEWVDEFDGHTIVSDESWEDGELFLEIYADHDGKYIIAVRGENMGEWYDIDLKTDGDPTGTDDPTKIDDPSDPDRPFGDFDLSGLPGYPIEIVGGVMLVAIIALIVPLKKKFIR